MIPELGIKNLPSDHHLYVVDSSFAKIYLRHLLNCAIYEKIIAQFSAVPFWFDKDTRSIVDGGNPADRA
jgi:hypothetical protein